VLSVIAKLMTVQANRKMKACTRDEMPAHAKLSDVGLSLQRLPNPNNIYQDE
jgi:hypothetical protein